MKIKYLLVTAVLATAILCSGAPANTSATGCMVGLSSLSAADQITCLQETISNLMAQIKVLQSKQGTPPAWCHTFNTNLRIGDSGSGVEALNIALEKQGFNASRLEGPDVSYTEAITFGEITASAVVAFQEKYASEILTPNNLKHGTGYVGPATRAKLNSLYGCKTIPITPINPTQPAITLLSPSAGPIGTNVTITGSGFAPMGNTISFGDWQIQNVSSSNGGTSITFTVPNVVMCYSDNGPIACQSYIAGSRVPSTYNVDVMSRLGLGGTSNALPFNVTAGTPSQQTPHINAVTPFLDTNRTQQFNVTGTGFLGSNPFVDGQSATYSASSLTDTSVTLLSVKQLAVAGTHTVYLVNPTTGQSNTVTFQSGVTTQTSITIDSLENVSLSFYDSDTGTTDNFTLVNGQATVSDANGTNPRVYTYINSAIGDLNGDGIPEGAISIYKNWGANRSTPIIFVVSNQNGVLTQITSVLPDQSVWKDKTQIQSLGIGYDGILRVTFLVLSETAKQLPGYQQQPSVLQMIQYKLIGNVLQNIGLG